MPRTARLRVRAFQASPWLSTRLQDGWFRWLNRGNEEGVPPEQFRETSRNDVIERQENQKSCFDNQHCTAGKLRVGDLAVMRCVPQKTGEPTKTQIFRGPLVVTEVLPADTYRVSDVRGPKRRIYSTTANISQRMS